MRIFVSIGWSAETMEYFLELQKELQVSGVKGYWRRGENLHLTLKFLGEVNPHVIPDIKRVLRESVRGFHKFNLQIKGLGVFPNLRAPRILWVGVTNLELNKLQHQVEESLEHIGFGRENRKFRPHVTLASGSVNGLTTDILDKDFCISENVKAIELMESVVEHGKRWYKCLERFDLL